jgi:hypothetical protein
MTTPTPTATPAVPDADRALAALAHASGELLAAHTVQALTDHAGSPTCLPELLFPDLDPDTVLRVWKVALPIGYRIGRQTARPAWDTAALQRLRSALADAGYATMARTLPAEPAADQAAAGDGGRP